MEIRIQEQLMEPITINARILAFEKPEISQEEILRIVGTEKIAGLKYSDPHPYLKAISIIHEGEAEPILDGRKTHIEFPKTAVQSLQNLEIPADGIPLYDDFHDINNSNRPVIAKIIAGTQRLIGNKLHHVFIAYAPGSTRDNFKEKNVFSMEAMWHFIPRAGKIIANKIIQLAGIATGKDTEADPAFSGARELGWVQAFARVNESNEEQQSITKSTQEKPFKMSELTMEQIRQAIKNAGFDDLISELKNRRVLPHQIVKPEDLFGKRLHLKDGSVQIIGGDSIFNEWLAKHEDDIRSEFNADKQSLEDITKERDELKKSNLRYSAWDQVIAHAKEQNLPDTALAVLDELKGEFSPEKDDKNHIKSKVEELVTRAKERDESIRTRYGVQASGQNNGQQTTKAPGTQLPGGQSVPAEQGGEGQPKYDF